MDEGPLNLPMDRGPRKPPPASQSLQPCSNEVSERPVLTGNARKVDPRLLPMEDQKPAAQPHPLSTRERLLEIHRKAAKNCYFIKPVPYARVVPAPKLGKNGLPVPLSSKERRENRELHQKWVRLQELQRHRVALAAELAEVQCRAAQATQPTIGASLASSKPSDTNTAVAPNAREAQANLIRFNDLRHIVCLNAAFRLAGFSMYPNDQEELALRFDIQLNRDESDSTRPDVVHHCCHCFFKIVAKGDKHYLIVTQNTFPQAISVATIVGKHFGEGLFLGTATDRDIVSDKTALPTLRAVAQQLYTACYHWYVRKDTYEYLQHVARRPVSVVAPVDTRDSIDAMDHGGQQRPIQPCAPSYSIDCVEGAAVGSLASYKKIRFQLKLPELIADVTLSYASDLCREDAHRPSSATITVVKPGTPVQTRQGRSSQFVDESTDDEDPFLLDAKKAFLTMSIANALEFIARKATER